MAESCSSAHQVFPGDSPAFFKGGRGAHGAFGGNFGESDWRATEEELEQAVSTRPHWVACPTGERRARLVVCKKNNATGGPERQYKMTKCGPLDVSTLHKKYYATRVSWRVTGLRGVADALVVL